MHKIWWSVAILCVVILIIGIVRYSFLSNIKLGLEVEFYQKAIKHMDANNDKH